MPPIWDLKGEFFRLFECWFKTNCQVIRNLKILFYYRYHKGFNLGSQFLLVYTRLLQIHFKYSMYFFKKYKNVLLCRLFFLIFKFFALLAGCGAEKPMLLRLGFETSYPLFSFRQETCNQINNTSSLFSFSATIIPEEFFAIDLKN